MSNTIPEGWSIVPIGDICNIAIGGTPSRSIPDYWDSSKTTGSPWVSIRDLNKPWIHETSEWITEAGIKHSNVKLVRKGTVLMSFKLSVGRVAFAGRDLYTNEAIAAFLPQKKNEYSDQFLYQGLQHWNLLENIDQAVKGVTLNKEKINQIETLLPPLPEQKKIAAILSSVDEVIEKTRAQIDKLKDLKAGMMQELLTKGIGPGGVPHTEFKDSPVGRIPAGWEVTKLDQVAKVVDSLHQTPTFANEGLPMIRVSDIKPGKVNIERAYKVSQEIFNQFTKNHKPQKGDLLMSRVGSYGVCCYLDRELDVCLGQNTVVIIPNRISHLFLYHTIYSEAVQNQIEFEVAGSGYKSLSLASIRSLSIPLPPEEEQKQIADVLISIDARIEVSARKLKGVTDAKKALMQDLLTGKVRVQVDTRELAEA